MPVGYCALRGLVARQHRLSLARSFAVDADIALDLVHALHGGVVARRERRLDQTRNTRTGQQAQNGKLFQQTAARSVHCSHSHSKVRRSAASGSTLKKGKWHCAKRKPPQYFVAQCIAPDVLVTLRRNARWLLRPTRDQPYWT